jgi:hypothetical protein
MPPFSPGARLIVLGAGATRGAYFAAEEFTPTCDPPLNADFFTQLQRITGPARRRQLVEQVMRAGSHRWSPVLGRAAPGVGIDQDRIPAQASRVAQLAASACD